MGLREWAVRASRSPTLAEQGWGTHFGDGVSFLFPLLWEMQVPPLRFASVGMTKPLGSLVGTHVSKARHGAPILVAGWGSTPPTHRDAMNGAPGGEVLNDLR
jgi:hypothetical protein